MTIQNNDNDDDDDDDDNDDNDDDDDSTTNIRQTRRRIRPRLSNNLPVSVYGHRGDRSVANVNDLTDPKIRQKWMGLTDPKIRQKWMGKLPLVDAHSAHQINPQDNRCHKCGKNFPSLLQLSRHLSVDHL